VDTNRLQSKLDYPSQIDGRHNRRNYRQLPVKSRKGWLNSLSEVSCSIARTTASMVSFAAKSLVACTGTVLLCSTALPQASVEARSVSYELNIPAENLDAALQALALASHHKLLYRAELVAGKASKELVGSYTTEEGVTRLLEGTKLSFEITPAWG
jgi:hypothetical protein